MKATDRFVFMKVGEHAGEDFSSILKRKREEFRVSGMTLWGYGGPTCHPITQVRPFVMETLKGGSKVHLLMEPMDSKADPDVVPATEYSEDGITWQTLPNGIHVTGSRYAIVMGEIHEEDIELSLHQYSIGLGKSEGKVASDYIQGRVDKACLIRDDGASKRATRERMVQIKYSAELLAPYAVLLRGSR